MNKELSDQELFDIAHEVSCKIDKDGLNERFVKLYEQGEISNLDDVYQGLSKKINLRIFQKDGLFTILKHCYHTAIRHLDNEFIDRNHIFTYYTIEDLESQVGALFTREQLLEVIDHERYNADFDHSYMMEQLGEYAKYLLENN